MDKSNKNRTDLLAAGRKRLQQFRKKKDQKGSSSGHTKSSGKAKKPENDGDSEEPSEHAEAQHVTATDGAEGSKTDQSDLPASVEPANDPSVASADKMDQEELSSISLNPQEDSRAESQGFNGEMPENRRDDSEGPIYEMAPDSEKTVEDVAAASEVVQERNDTSFASEVIGDGEETSVANVVADERNNGHQSFGEQNAGGGMGEETTLHAHEAAPQSSLLMGGIEEAGLNLLHDPGVSSSPEESLELPYVSADNLSIKGEGRSAVVADEGEREYIEEDGRAEENINSYTLAEEAKIAGTNSFGESEVTNTLEESSAAYLSSYDSAASEGENGMLVVKEEEERRNGEQIVMESGTVKVGVKSSIHDRVEEVSDPLYSAESALVGETSEDISSSPPTALALVGADAAVTGESEKISHIDENVESIVITGKNVQATEQEADGAVATGDEGRATEGSVLQSSMEDTIVESSKSLPEQGITPPLQMAEGTNKKFPPPSSSSSEVDHIRQLLYMTTVEKHALQLQLEEQIALNEEHQQHSSDELSKLRYLLEESQDNKAVISKELDQCRSGLQTVAAAKEELQARLLSMEGEMEAFRSRAVELQNRLEEYQEELSHAFIQLSDCRVSVETLQKENYELTENLSSERDAREELVKENAFLSSENKKLVSEVLDKKGQLIGALDREAELHSNLRDAGESIEQLLEENMYLATHVTVENETIMELTRSLMSPCLQKHEEQSGSTLFKAFKQHLEDANDILNKLEKSVDGMHSHTLSFSRSSARVAAPGVSKIIQAFELKSPRAENISDEIPFSVEGGRAEYSLTKEQTNILKDVLNKMDRELANAELYSVQNSREHTNMSGMESDLQKDQSNLLQKRIDALVEKSSDYKSKIVDLQNHIDAMQLSSNEETARLLSQVGLPQKELNDRVPVFNQEEDSFWCVISDAVGKLNASTGLQVDAGLDVKVHAISSIEAAVLEISSLHEKLEAAHLKIIVFQTSLEDLNKSVMDVQGRNEFAFDLLKTVYSGLIEFVYDLHEGDAADNANTDESLELFRGKFDMLTGQMKKLMNERQHLISKNQELEDGILKGNNEIEELKMRCDTLAKKLEDELNLKERLELLLMDKDRLFKEVGDGVLSLAHKLEEHELSKDFDAISILTKSDSEDSDYFHSTLLRIAALVDFFLQKHGEAIKLINSSKTYLQEVDIASGISSDDWSLPLDTLLRYQFVPKVSELTQKIHLLSASNLQQDTEIQILKESLGRMEEALEASHSELNLKISELEQSEQKLASVREKLSIAVAKGKGLIVQRDGLKQSLMEKSNELEKCMQELQSKETLLREVEEKLKSCSEVDRVESLESELSYIRDSATALRDSFLLKDSILQRIEEVLEDLDLPEYFHSKDIVEKIELLSRMAAGNSSFAVTEWDQKSSEGHSHSESGFVVMDPWKDDAQPNAVQEFNELKRKYEELQSKFYGVAEHNDMLEQSLLERNSLVQKWEEMLDRIDLPSHMKTLEPEDKIQSLARALTEIQHERDALQLKIENLEDSSDMLIVDLEESHKKISELSAEVVTVKSEKDFFSESLDKLRFQYLAVSEKAEHDEVEKENLQRELVDLQEKLAARVEDEGYHNIENEMQTLQDLVLNLLPDSDKVENVSQQSSIASLEPLLRKLIDNYTTLSSVEPKHIPDSREVDLEESISSLNKHPAPGVLHDTDQELFGLRSELDETAQSLVLVKEDLDATMKKCQFLRSELDKTAQGLLIVEEERDAAMGECQSLRSDLDEAAQSLVLANSERDAAVGECQSLRSDLDEAAQSLVLVKVERDTAMEKCQSLRSELDETVQSLALVKEERDTAVEKCQSLTLEIENLNDHLSLLQEERTQVVEKCQSLLMELEAVSRQRDALQEQQTLEDQKSAATREKLNVAVRKGKGLVQQRDALKQTIEEMNTKMESLKLEHSQQVEAFESEKFLFVNQLSESNQNLSRLLTAVHSINVGTDANITDPFQKLEEIGRVYHHLQSAVTSSEQEAKRSKQAAELLLAELNEVQDRVDILQEDLGKAEAQLAESYKQKLAAETAKVDAFSHLEQLMSVHSEEKKKHINNLLELQSGINQLRKGCIEFSGLLSDVFVKDSGFFSNLQAFLESILKEASGENLRDLPILGSKNLLHINPISTDDVHAVGDVLERKIDSQFGDELIAEHLAHACSNLHECMKEYEEVKQKVHHYVLSAGQQKDYFSQILETIKGKFGSQKEYTESLKRELITLELANKEKETEICSLHKNVSLLYEACSSSIAEIEKRKAQAVGSSFDSESHFSKTSSLVATSRDHVEENEYFIPLADHSVRLMADSLLSAIQSSTYTNEAAEGNQRQLKDTILDLQRELQEKDIEIRRISEELVSQIRDAEAVATRSLEDVDSARAQVFSLEKKVAEVQNDKQLLELRISKLKDFESLSQELQERVKSLTDLLVAKDQEIEGLNSGLMQALDDEESKLEALENRNKELEDLVQEKMMELENLEASKAKALAKLSTTVSKFDELHNLSESLLSEIERLESQLQEKDSEISFLRQEVTRCTNNDLTSQETYKKYLSEINELLKWMKMMLSHLGEPEIHADDQNCSQVLRYIEVLDKKLISVMKELEDLRVTSQSKDALLQIERERLEELQCTIKDRETVHEAEIHREPFEEAGDSAQLSNSRSPGHMAIEQMVQRNKMSSAPAVTHIRSGRKVNTDQIAIAIDMEKDDDKLEDEDDDKAHGFKSLTASHLVPRFTRPISDRIDGIWVSAERLLMRQPSLRLGVIVYWVLLHAFLASII